jgi:hypothetical protein
MVARTEHASSQTPHKRQASNFKADWFAFARIRPHLPAWRWGLTIRSAECEVRKWNPKASISAPESRFGPEKNADWGRKVRSNPHMCGFGGISLPRRTKAGRRTGYRSLWPVLVRFWFGLRNADLGAKMQKSSVWSVSLGFHMGGGNRTATMVLEVRSFGMHHRGTQTRRAHTYRNAPKSGQKLDKLFDNKMLCKETAPRLCLDFLRLCVYFTRPQRSFTGTSVAIWCGIAGTLGVFCTKDEGDEEGREYAAPTALGFSFWAVSTNMSHLRCWGTAHRSRRFGLARKLDFA